MDIEEHLQCPICFERFSSPRSLNNCLHTFCEDCLFQTFVSFEKKNRFCTEFPCPVCRKTVDRPPTLPRVTKDWVKTFPINHVVNSLLNIAVKDEPNCEPCSNLNKNAKADHFCRECQEFICSACSQLHSTFNAMKSHELVTLEDLKADKMHALDLSKFLQCPLHKDKNVELFCEDDLTPVCVLCVSTNHRNCKNVVELKGLAESSDAEEKSKKWQENLKGIQHRLACRISKMEQNQTDLNAQEPEIKKALKERRRKMNTMFDMYESDVLEQAKSLREKKFNSLGEDIVNSKRLLSAVKSSCTSFGTVVKYGSKSHTFTTLNRMQSQFEQYESLMKDSIEAKNEKIELVDKMPFDRFLHEKCIGYAQLWPYKIVPKAIKGTSSTTGEGPESSVDVFADSPGVRITVEVEPVASGSGQQNGGGERFKKNNLMKAEAVRKDKVVLEGGGNFEEGQAYLIHSKDGSSKTMLLKDGKFIPYDAILRRPHRH